MDTVLRGRAAELFAEALPRLDGGKAEGNKWRYMEEQNYLFQLLISVCSSYTGVLTVVAEHVSIEIQGNRYLHCLYTPENSC